MLVLKNFKNQTEIKNFLKNKIGVYDQGIEIMTKKAETLNIFITDLKNQAAAILKQDILSLGGELAVSADVVRFEKGTGNVLLMVNQNQLEKLLPKLKQQPFGLKELANELERINFNFNKEMISPPMDFVNGVNTFGRNDKNNRMQIMGILNLTPDSFSDGGKYNSVDSAIKRVDEMISEGADIIDIGAESSRPSSKPITENEELKRLLPVLKEITKRFKVKISVDTYKTNVAKIVLENGASMINDIYAMTFDKNMPEIIKKFGCEIVLMHMQNTPENMQVSPSYDDVVLDILKFLKERIDFALSCGIKKEKIIIDPGIGFGKTLEHNLEILKRIEEFKILGFPILVGASRKSFIGKAVDERFFGSLAVATLMQNKGVDILRVHDVGATKEVCRMANLI